MLLSYSGIFDPSLSFLLCSSMNGRVVLLMLVLEFISSMVEVGVISPTALCNWHSPASECLLSLVVLFLLVHSLSSLLSDTFCSFLGF